MTDAQPSIGVWPSSWIRGHRRGEPDRDPLIQVHAYDDRTVVLRQNGTKFTDVRRVTDAEGEIDLDRVRDNQAGKDRFRFRAVDQVNGEVCTGTLSI